MSRQWLGEFEQLVLLALLQLDGEAYGVPVLEQIRQRTGRKVARAAVYIALRRLEKAGLVASRLGEPTAARGGRPKRFFQVKPGALEQLRASRAALDAMWQGLESTERDA